MQKISLFVILSVILTMPILPQFPVAIALFSLSETIPGLMAAATALIPNG